MKSLLLSSICVVMLLSANAQITLEHNYTNIHQDFTLVPIDSGEYKYVDIDRNNNAMTLYNLDHSVYTVINFPLALHNMLLTNFYYITRRLFDCDSTHLEYMVAYQDTLYNPGVSIYNDAGTLLFNEPGYFANLQLTDVGWYQVPVYNTPLGAKMLLRPNNGVGCKVYSLCGTLPLFYYNPTKNDIYTRAFPNPSAGQISIAYQLPENCHEADLLIVDLNGQLVKQYRVTDAFNTIIVPTNALPTGTYTYSIRTNVSTIASGKLIKVE